MFGVVLMVEWFVVVDFVFGCCGDCVFFWSDGIVCGVDCVGV